MAKQRIKVTPSTDQDQSRRVPETAESLHAVDSAQIAALAYQLWQERGCPTGSPETDWFQAEQQLRGQAGAAGRDQISGPLLMRGTSV